MFKSLEEVTSTSKPKIFIDGRGGVVGTKIYEWLSERDDLEFFLIDPDKRRDVEERRRFLNAADLVLLCLPEDTAQQAVELVENQIGRASCRKECRSRWSPYH